MITQNATEMDGLAERMNKQFDYLDRHMTARRLLRHWVRFAWKGHLIWAKGHDPKSCEWDEIFQTSLKSSEYLEFKKAFALGMSLYSAGGYPFTGPVLINHVELMRKSGAFQHGFHSGVWYSQRFAMPPDILEDI
ncbi:MAG: hypothetical protein K2L83_05055 [Muribaculaceae bacterium]|nr:hypothetical protein [Muribaculaceae bacterium]